jgi:hypothetical protein
MLSIELIPMNPDGTYNITIAYSEMDITRMKDEKIHGKWAMTRLTL